MTDVLQAVVLIRPALVDDLNRLVELEDSCFDTDRMSRRSFRHFLQQNQHYDLTNLLNLQLEF